MTWPGAPTVYYGDEAGVCGFTDPDNRRTYPWGHEDHELISFHRDMIRIHKENQELKTGSLCKALADYNIIAYARFNQKAQCLIAVNNNPREVVKDITVWQFGIPMSCSMTRLMLTYADGYTTQPQEYAVVNGRVHLTLPPTSAIVLRHVSE